ncbi:MAG: hypothetical protein ACUVTZ_10570 [Armatimonadota bacterium]
MKVSHAELGGIAVEVLSRGGRLRFTAPGHSMHPLIRNADIVTIEHASAEQLRLGDVALYRSHPNRLVLHRVVGWTCRNGHRVLFIRGDASDGPAEEVPAERILGRAVMLERDGRVVRLDRGLARLVGILWVRFSPWSRRAYLTIERIGRLPRRIARKAAGVLGRIAVTSRSRPEHR